MLIGLGRLKSIIAEAAIERKAGDLTPRYVRDLEDAAARRASSKRGLDDFRRDGTGMVQQELDAEFEPKPGDVFELTYSDTTMGNVELGTINRPARSGVDSEDDSESDDEAYRRYLRSMGIKARVFDGKVKILSVE